MECTLIDYRFYFQAVILNGGECVGDMGMKDSELEGENRLGYRDVFLVTKFLTRTYHPRTTSVQNDGLKEGSAGTVAYSHWDQ